MEAFRPLVFVYIFERFFFRIFEFLRRWYLGFGLVVLHATMHRLESFDRTLALKITLTHFFSPLFGDRSIMGRALGIIFRTFRVIVASVIYFFIITIALFLYVCWALIPVVALLKIFGF